MKTSCKGILQHACQKFLVKISVTFLLKKIVLVMENNGLNPLVSVFLEYLKAF